MRLGLVGVAVWSVLIPSSAAIPLVLVPSTVLAPPSGAYLGLALQGEEDTSLEWLQACILNSSCEPNVALGFCSLAIINYEITLSIVQGQGTDRLTLRNYHEPEPPFHDPPPMEAVATIGQPATLPTHGHHGCDAPHFTVVGTSVAAAAAYRVDAQFG